MSNYASINSIGDISADVFASQTVQSKSGIESAKAAAAAKDRNELKKAAQQFEAIFINQLLKVMRETIEETDSSEGGFGKTIYTEMFDQEIAQNMAKSGALGIGDILYKNLSAQNSGTDQTSDVKGGTNQSTDKTSSGQEISELQLPVSAPISSQFGVRRDPINHQSRFHKGIDLAAPEGMKVVPAMPGKVIESGYNQGYGNYVLIQHSGDLQTRYGHLASIDVKAGDLVDSETSIGKVGSTGRSTGPHLHFEVIKKGKAVDPISTIGEQQAELKRNLGGPARRTT